MEEYANVKLRVEHGLEKIDANRKIEVSLKDFLYLHNTIEEFVRFFHQPMHYRNLEDVNKFLGNKDAGALHLLWEILYHKFNYRDIFPEDIQNMIDNSGFEKLNYP